jgi:hypothetical protein
MRDNDIVADLQNELFWGLEQADPDIAAKIKLAIQEIERLRAGWAAAQAELNTYKLQEINRRWETVCGSDKQTSSAPFAGGADDR